MWLRNISGNVLVVQGNIKMPKMPRWRHPLGGGRFMLYRQSVIDTRFIQVAGRRDSPLQRGTADVGDFVREENCVEGSRIISGIDSLMRPSEKPRWSTTFLYCTVIIDRTSKIVLTLLVYTLGCRPCILLNQRSVLLLG